MRSKLGGRPTSGVEVRKRTSRGVWFLLDGKTIFASFRDFPWFRGATMSQLMRIERPSPHHLYWPELDVDLEVESLVHPERYPLMSRI